MSDVPKNTVTLLDNGIVEVNCCGAQDAETLSTLVHESQALIAEVRRNKLPILILVRIQGMRSVNVSVRRLAANALKKMPYNKVAIYGASRFLEKTLDLIIRAVDKEDKIRVFPGRQEALLWLNEAAMQRQLADSGDESAYRQYVEYKLEQLNDIISLAVIGEYSKDIPIPKEEDEFTDTFVGIRLLVETLEEKARRIGEMVEHKSARK